MDETDPSLGTCELLVEDPDIEKPRELNVLTAFEEIRDLLEVYAPFRKDLSYEAMKKGRYEVSFHKWVGPFADPEKQTDGKADGKAYGKADGKESDYRVTIKTGKFPVGINPYHIRYRGSWEGVEHDIKQDIEHLESLGFKNIKFLGYQGYFRD
jgi:hypothetical protein